MKDLFTFEEALGLSDKIPKTFSFEEATNPLGFSFDEAMAEDNGKGRLASAAQSFLRGGGVGAGQTLSGISRLGDLLARSGLMIGPGGAIPLPDQSATMEEAAKTPAQREAAVQEDPLYRVGQNVSRAATEAFQPNPKFRGELMADVVPGSAGQMIPTLAVGVVNPVLAGAQYGLSSGQQMAEEAVAAGRPEEAQTAFLATLPIGAISEGALGAAANAARIAKGAVQAGAKGIAKAAAASATKEAVQEGVEQVGQNLVASDMAGYDPNRPVTQDVLQSMAAGAVLGGLIGGAAHAVGAMSNPNDSSAPPRNEIPEIPAPAPESNELPAGLEPVSEIPATETDIAKTISEESSANAADVGPVEQVGSIGIPMDPTTTPPETAEPSTLPPETAATTGNESTRETQAKAALEPIPEGGENNGQEEGQKELLSQPGPAPESQTAPDPAISTKADPIDQLRVELGSAMTDLTLALTAKGIVDGPGVGESALRVYRALSQLAFEYIRKGVTEFGAWIQATRLPDNPATRRAWAQATGNAPEPQAHTDLTQAESQALGELPVRAFSGRLDAAPDVAPEIKAAVGNVLYQRKPNETTAQMAARIVQAVGSPEAALDVFRDRTNGLGGAERTMLGQLVVKQLSQQGKHAEAARFIDEDLLPYSTDAGQALQAFAAFGALSPQGVVAYGRRQFDRANNGIRQRLSSAVDAAADAMGDINRKGIDQAANAPDVQRAAGDLVADAVVADASKPNSPIHRAITVRSADGLRQWILLHRESAPLRKRIADLTGRLSYWHTILKAQQKSLSSAIEAAIKGQTGEAPPPNTVQRLASDLTRVLRQQVDATLKRQPGGMSPRLASQQLLNLLSNSERLSELWGAIRQELQGNTEPAALAILGSTVDVWSKPLLANVAREYLKSLDVSMAELVRNHYVEVLNGNPTPLATKIVEWLGLDAAEANRLAKAFDQVFADQSKAIRDGLKKRVDAVKRDPRWKRILRSGLSDPERMSDIDLDAAVADGIRQHRLDMGQLIRRHYTEVNAAGASLAKSITATAGVPAPVAERLARQLEIRFREVVQAAKARAVAKIEAEMPKLPGQAKQAWQRIVELSNLGALNRETAWRAVAEKLGLPVWSPEIARELTQRADEISRTPDGIVRQRKVIEMHNWLARTMGVPKVDLAMAFWYANILSGPTTHALNILSNTLNLAANTVAEMRHPRDVVAQLQAGVRGARVGALDAADILRTGIVTRSGGVKLGPGKPLEVVRLKGLVDYLLTPWRTVGRALSAADAVFFRSAEEMRATLLARQLARSEGLSGDALKRRVAQLLGRTFEQRFRAVRQALREGAKDREFLRRVDDIQQQSRPEELTSNARDYAFKVTFNQKPYGLLGAIAQGINWAGSNQWGMPLRLVVPFTNIVANVTNESLNYLPPVGAFRGIWGHWKGELDGKPITDPNALGDQWAKVATGTVLLGVVFAAAEAGLNDDDPAFAVYGAGPKERNRKNQLRAGGWIPHSIKIGGRYYAYGNTPMAIPMAMVGNYFDAIRYKELDQQDAINRVAYVMSNAGRVIMEQSFLDGIARVVASLERDNVKAGDTMVQTVARTASSVAIPNAIRQVDRVFDPTVYDANGAQAAMTASIPFARRVNRPTLNVWGEPVQNPIWRRFGSDVVPDPQLALLAKRNLWISAPTSDQVRIAGQPITADEHYEFVRERGKALRAMLSNPSIGKVLNAASDDAAKVMWERIQTAATLQAKGAIVKGRRQP